MQALLRRIQLIEDDLEKSDERLRTTTQKLAEAHQAADESDRVRKTLENKTNQEDDKITELESQLAQARQIAEESDKKYEEVRLKVLQELSSKSSKMIKKLASFQLLLSVGVCLEIVDILI